jgi:hypothetical protein
LRLLNTLRPPSHYPSPTRSEWVKILRRCKRVDTGYDTPCWIWLGYIDSDGYGEVKFRGFKRFVHRIACAWARCGRLEGNTTEHRCKQRACCNPDHLSLMSNRDNAAGRSDPFYAPAQVNATSFRPIDVPF